MKLSVMQLLLALRSPFENALGDERGDQGQRRIRIQLCQSENRQSLCPQHLSIPYCRTSPNQVVFLVALTNRGQPYRSKVKNGQITDVINTFALVMISLG